MKKILFTIITAITFACNGQKTTETETITKANKLIADKKYESAFNLLQEADTSNENPDIFLLKEDILLNYFVSSMMHQAFALRDIDKNEDIMDYRGKEGSYSMYFVKIDSVLLKLIKKYPDNCKLYKGLADYYYDVDSKYGEQWLIDEANLQDAIITNYQKAISGWCADYDTYFAVGITYLQQEKEKASIPYFRKAIELDGKSADAIYNLAYAYIVTQQFDSALYCAKTAMNLYTDNVYKGDAATVVGRAYTAKKDYDNALKYYEKAVELCPDDFYKLKDLLEIYLVKHDKRASEITKKIFDLAPENPTIYQDLQEKYYYYGNVNDLINFYKSQLSVYKWSDHVVGNLHFYIANIYMDSDKKNAKKYFLQAKESFKKIFESDHYVFEVIEDALKKCDK